MRRSDKEITDIGVIEEILSKATVCRLGLCADDRPYVVSVCFGYADNALYFHCAAEGKKLDILRKNDNVCFEVDVDREVVKGSRACEWGLKYRSVVGFGKAVFLEDVESKRKGLDIIMRQFSENAFEYPEKAVDDTIVIKIEIESMTGKRSG